MPPSDSNAVASSSRHPARRTANGHTNGDIDGTGVDTEVVEEDGWTINTFVDRPIPNSTETQALFRALIERLRTARHNTTTTLERAKEAAKAIEDAKPDDPLFHDLVKLFQNTLKHRAMLDIKIKVLEEVDLAFRQNHEMVNPAKIFQRDCEQFESEYENRTDRQKFMKDPDYISFQTEVWEINHPGVPCPPMSHFIPKDTANGEESDEDDYEMGGQTQHYRCPVTFLPFEDVVSSTLCPHSYSRTGIMDVIARAPLGGRRGANKSTKCPVAGCQTRISEADLKPNESLQKRADEYWKRQKRREAEDSEEDDE